MEKFLKNIKNKYEELNKKNNDLTLKEEKLKEEHDVLLDEYNLCNKAYNNSCDAYAKYNNRLEDKKKKYIKKKHNRHVNLVMLISLIICLTIAGINSYLGLIVNKFSACMGCLLLSSLLGLVDINLFWDRLRKKYEKDFDELDSTKKSKETLDKLYVQKLRNEKGFNDIKIKVIKHSKIISEVTREKNKVEKEINDLKVKFFKEIIVEPDIDKFGLTNNDTMQINEKSQEQSGKKLVRKLTPPKNR